jgi:hypothetical protein
MLMISPNRAAVRQAAAQSASLPAARADAAQRVFFLCAYAFRHAVFSAN